jgi:hypothetical protein
MFLSALNHDSPQCSPIASAADHALPFIHPSLTSDSSLEPKRHLIGHTKHHVPGSCLLKGTSHRHHTNQNSNHAHTNTSSSQCQRTCVYECLSSTARMQHVDPQFPPYWSAKPQLMHSSHSIHLARLKHRSWTCPFFLFYLNCYHLSVSTSHCKQQAAPQQASTEASTGSSIEACLNFESNHITIPCRCAVA